MNMQRQFEELKKSLDAVALSKREREKIKSRVRAFMTLHPERPLAVILPTKRSWVPSFPMRGFSMRSLAWRPLALAFSFVLVAGAGTSYAARATLPGDGLYSVKINLNEPIEGLFASSESSMAQWDLELAKRRLNEAQTLAQRGDLTPVKDQIVEAQLASVTKKFNADIATLSTASGSSTEAASAESSIKATFAAQAASLSSIASSTPSTKAAVAPILAAVAADTQAINASNATSTLGASSTLAIATTTKPILSATSAVSTTTLAKGFGATTTLSIANSSSSASSAKEAQGATSSAANADSNDSTLQASSSSSTIDADLSTSSLVKKIIDKLSR